MLNAADSDVVDAVRQELLQVVGINQAPLFSRVYRWPNAMAQYGVGHLERLDRIEHLRQQLPGLYLAGNAYRGIGVPDCVRSGKDAAGAALQALGVSTSQAVMH
jgi:oxygen-dependent protoporphyrinogen oxidase